MVTAVGDRKVSDLEGLAKAVQDAGKDGKKLSLSVIRGGDQELKKQFEQLNQRVKELEEAVKRLQQ